MDGKVEKSAGDVALDGLAEEMGIDPAFLLLFFMAYETAIGKGDDDEGDTTPESVAAFRQYLLGGGQNVKRVIQGAEAGFDYLTRNGTRFNMGDGRPLDQSGFEEICQDVKTWVARNGGETKSGGCYVATAVYGSYDCPQVWTLRRYRDNHLGSSWCGRLFIKAYYAASPMLVRLFAESSWFNAALRPPLDKLVARLGHQGYNDTPYYD
jgi:hypothetical protein